MENVFYVMEQNMLALFIMSYSFHVGQTMHFLSKYLPYEFITQCLLPSRQLQQAVVYFLS